MLSNDFDPDNVAPLAPNSGLLITSFPNTTGSNGGIFVFTNLGFYSYTPPAGRTGFVDCVYYSVVDLNGGIGFAESAKAKLCVTVGGSSSGGGSGVGAATPPSATDDLNFTTPDTPITGNVLSNDFDNAFPNLAATLVVVTTGSQKGSGGGVFVMNKDGSYTYNPPTHKAGITDCVVYKINETGRGSGIGLATTAKLCVNVGSNHGPVANPDRYTSPFNAKFTTPDVRQNDVDEDGTPWQSFTITAYSAPVHGTVTLTGGGIFEYRPVKGFSGADQFDYTINDGFGGTAHATVSIVVGDNDDPTAADDVYGSPENPIDGSKSFRSPFSVLDNDRDTQTLKITELNGSALLQPMELASGAKVFLEGTTGMFTYVPAKVSALVQDTFVYTVIDRQGGETTARVTLFVKTPAKVLGIQVTKTTSKSTKTTKTTKLTVKKPVVRCVPAQPAGNGFKAAGASRKVVLCSSDPSLLKKKK